MGNSMIVRSALEAANQLKNAILWVQEQPEIRVQWGDNACAEDLARVEKWIYQLKQEQVNEVWREVQNISRILSSDGYDRVRMAEREMQKAVLEAAVEFRDSGR